MTCRWPAHLGEQEHGPQQRDGGQAHVRGRNRGWLPGAAGHRLPAVVHALLPPLTRCCRPMYTFEWALHWLRGKNHVTVQAWQFGTLVGLSQR